nr:protein argonaute 4-like isoform X1 [Tanacetum cinerariifolium]
MAMDMGSKIESHILEELKEIAVDVGLEIERHNKALNPLDDDVEGLTIRVKVLINACKFLDEKWCLKYLVIITQKNHHTEFSK